MLMRNAGMWYVRSHEIGYFDETLWSSICDATTVCAAMSHQTTLTR